MIRQTILAFKVEMTRDLINPHAGLALLGEFAAGLGLSDSVDRYLPKPGSGAGYNPSEYTFPLILISLRLINAQWWWWSLEDTRQIRTDEGLREILPLERILSSDAFGDWLRSMGINAGLYGLEKVNRRLLKRGMKPVESPSALSSGPKGLQVERYDGIKAFTPLI